MARVQNLLGDWSDIDQEHVFRDFMGGESMEQISLKFNVHRYVIEKLVREECLRRDGNGN